MHMYVHTYVCVYVCVATSVNKKYDTLVELRCNLPVNSTIYVFIFDRINNSVLFKHSMRTYWQNAENNRTISTKGTDITNATVICYVTRFNYRGSS